MHAGETVGCTPMTLFNGTGIDDRMLHTYFSIWHELVQAETCQKVAKRPKKAYDLSQKSLRSISKKPTIYRQYLQTELFLGGATPHSPLITALLITEMLQNCISRSSENPNIDIFPLGQIIVGPFIRHWA